MAITSWDIARKVGVSQSTVSRALRADPRVAPQTLARVQAAARELGYAPNAAARSLITNRSRTIAVVVSDITNPFYPQLVDVLHDTFLESDYRTILLNEGTDSSGGDVIGQLAGGVVDGIVFVSATLQSTVPGEFVAAGVPIVLLNRDVDGLAADRVVSDNQAGGELAGRALLERGHERIGLIAGPSETSTGRDREAGFRAALEAAGLPLDESLRRGGDYSRRHGYDSACDLLHLPQTPTAVFCGNDVIAFGALDAARRAGVEVPSQLAVIGYDDVEMAGWEVFDLTTIRQPLPAMAKAAADLLVERIEGPDRPTRATVFPAGLVERSTTAAIRPLVTGK